MPRRSSYPMLPPTPKPKPQPPEPPDTHLDECPVCHTKAPPFVPPTDPMFTARCEYIRANYFPPEANPSEQEVIDMYLKVNGGYIALCTQCPSQTFFVKVM